MESRTAALSLWGRRSTFSEADIQIEGLQWNGMYFDNAAKAAVRECTEKTRGPEPATTRLAAEPVR